MAVRGEFFDIRFVCFVLSFSIIIFRSETGINICETKTENEREETEV